MNLNKESILYHIMSIIIIAFSILGVIAFTQSIMQDECKYCSIPAKTYDYGNGEYLKIYPESENIDTETALNSVRFDWNTTWYLCIDESDFLEEEFADCDSPTFVTTYYSIIIEYCPYCGRRLN